ncbi:MAG: tyrosine-type recombinase/integrase, partial [Alphaproteobacteria bacterium]|nr:tyrosine-type recombinase/integrase [Alphaproteobacteria bacterium]
EGWTLKRAQGELAKLREAHRLGTGEPTTLRGKRTAAATRRKLDETKAAEEARRNVTLATYFDETYAPWARATKVKAFRREGEIWRLWIGPALGALPIREIGIEQWHHLVKTAAAAGLSQRSREYVAGTLRRIMKHALGMRVVTEAPPSGKAVGATSPKDNRRTRTLADEDLRALLVALKARELSAWRVTLFAAATGCRASEAFNLRWGNLDIETGAATFPKTKNGKPRTVPLGAEVLAMLREMAPADGLAPVFLNSRGAPYRVAPSPFRDLVAEMRLNEGRDPQDRFSFHSLRHMAATRLARVLP